MNSNANHASRFTFHVSGPFHASFLLSAFCFLLFDFCFLLCAFPLTAQVWITNTITISETNTTYDGQDLVISGSGVTVAMDGPHAFNSLLITIAAVLTHSPCTATVTHKLDLTVTNAVVVSTNSHIDVSGLGYVAGRTTGNTTVGASTGYSAGSYGGLGGADSGTPNAVYGDYADPEDWGSGGDSASGGGRVRVAAETLQLDGQLLANGLTSCGGGAGSGGGILVVVTNLVGGGIIQSGGGGSPCGGRVSSGGGGRIAVYAANSSGFNLANVTAPGGVNGPAGAGTVYLRDRDESLGTLIIDAGSGGNGWTPLGLQGTNRTVIPDLVVIRGSNTHVQPVNTAWLLEFGTNVTISGGAQVSLTASNTVFDAPLVVNGSVVSVTGGLLDVGVPLVVTNSGQVNVTGAVNLHVPATLSGGGLLQVSGALTSSVPVVVDGGTLSQDYLVAPQLTLTNGAVLTCVASTASQMHKLEVQVAGTVLVSTNSRIDVSGLGYVAGRTSGNTTVGGATGKSGGSYGGLGGANSGGPNAVYGDYADVDDWGSGGGSNPGGGLVRLVADTLQLDGQLLANGSDGYTGAGAGGSIYVTVQTLAGVGSIRAGGGGNAYAGACGGGGRVAVYARDYSGFNLATVTALGGSAGSSSVGGAGTVYLRDRDESLGTLIIDAGSGGNGWTPLGLQGTNRTVIPDLVVIRGGNTHVMPVNTAWVLEFGTNVAISGGAQVSLTATNTVLDAPLVVNGAVVTVTGGLLDVAVPLVVTNSGQVNVTGAVNLRVPVTLGSGGLLQVSGAVTSSVPVVVDRGTLAADYLVAPALSLVNTGVLTCLASTASQMHKLEVQVAGTVLVSTNSRIDVTGTGYLAGRTSGNTTLGASTQLSGGSYGGLGGYYSGNVNAVYGDYADPEEWGSGGGAGPGGGRVRLVATTLQLEGQLLASGSSVYNGMGSGGGCWWW